MDSTEALPLLRRRPTRDINSERVETREARGGKAQQRNRQVETSR
jgi:hypothetical protein